MADDVDKTADRLEVETPYLIQASKKPVGPQPNGFCNWCNSAVGEGQKFCDSDCRNDYEHDQRRRRINGLTVKG